MKNPVIKKLEKSPLPKLDVAILSFLASVFFTVIINIVTFKADIPILISVSLFLISLPFFLFLIKKIRVRKYEVLVNDEISGAQRLLNDTDSSNMMGSSHVKYLTLGIGSYTGMNDRHNNRY